MLPRWLVLTSVGPAGGVVVIGVAFCVAPHPIALTVPASATTWINRYMCLLPALASAFGKARPPKQTSAMPSKRKAMRAPKADLKVDL
jgi:hypothetical protein